MKTWNLGVIEADLSCTGNQHPRLAHLLERKPTSCTAVSILSISRGTV